MNDVKTFNFSKNVAAPEVPGAKAGGNIITSWPKEETAIIAKLMCDPTYSNGSKIYRPANYYTHPTGNKQTDKSRHICRTFFGEKTSPENEKFWEIVKGLSQLKKQQLSDSQEARVLKEKLKIFKPSRRGYILFVRPESPNIQALRIPESIIDTLIGCKGDDYKEAKVSLIDTMIASGNSPFDLTSNTGWLKFYKRGESINTEYFVEPAEVQSVAETKDGKKVKYNEPLAAIVHSRFLEDLSIEEVPNVLAFEARFAFTVEESQAFVESEGSLSGVPARFRRNRPEQDDEESNVSQDQEKRRPIPSAADFRKVNEEDIPF